MGERFRLEGDKREGFHLAFQVFTTQHVPEMEVSKPFTSSVIEHHPSSVHYYCHPVSIPSPGDDFRLPDLFLSERESLSVYYCAERYISDLHGAKQVFS